MKINKNQITQFFIYIYQRNKYVFVIIHIIKKMNNDKNFIYNPILKLSMFIRRDTQLIYELSMI